MFCVCVCVCVCVCAFVFTIKEVLLKFQVAVHVQQNMPSRESLVLRCVEAVGNARWCVILKE